MAGRRHNDTSRRRDDRAAGHRDGEAINLRLAKLAGEVRWPMGLGSQRRELHDPEAAAEWKRLMEPADLLPHVGSEVAVVDIRSPKEFNRGSIKGAVNAPYGSWRGPKDNPGQVLTDAQLTERLQSLGLTATTPVVVTYPGKDATQFGAAARVYWTLKSVGLKQIAILNGGQKAWTAAGLPIGTDVRVVKRSDATFTLSGEWQITQQGVLDVVQGNADAQIIDARPVAFLQGKKKHKAARIAGTLKGAANVTHSTWFTGTDKGRIASAEDVLRLAREAGVEDGSRRPLASFCNTGHWAATNWFALSEMAGIDNVEL